MEDMKRTCITTDTKHRAGYFDKAEDAARARDGLARRLFGEYARLNFDLKETQYEGV